MRKHVTKRLRSIIFRLYWWVNLSLLPPSHAASACHRLLPRTAIHDWRSCSAGVSNDHGIFQHTWHLPNNAVRPFKGVRSKDCLVPARNNHEMHFLFLFLLFTFLKTEHNKLNPLAVTGIRFSAVISKLNVWELLWILLANYDIFWKYSSGRKFTQSAEHKPRLRERRSKVMFTNVSQALPMSSG